MPAHPHPPSVPEFRRIDGSIRAKHEYEAEGGLVSALLNGMHGVGEGAGV